MRGLVIILIAMVLMGGLLASAAYASYNGYGIVASGSPSARGGSLGGPVFFGGGPSGGK
jgi:hypothetical protein